MYTKAGTGGNMKEYLKPEVIVLDKKNMPAVFLSGDGICFLGYKGCSNNYTGTGVCDKGYVGCGFCYPIEKEEE